MKKKAYVESDDADYLALSEQFHLFIGDTEDPLSTAAKVLMNLGTEAGLRVRFEAAAPFSRLIEAHTRFFAVIDEAATECVSDADILQILAEHQADLDIWTECYKISARVSRHECCCPRRAGAR